MNFEFHPDAKRELDEAIDHYESLQTGLGREFASEVFAAIERVLRFPKAYVRLSENTRRCLVKRFPFGIVYRTKTEKDDEVLIVAVMHQNRKPNYWKSREK